MTVRHRSSLPPREEGAAPGPPARCPTAWWAGYAAGAWAILYAIPHLYWAVGGTSMLYTVRPAASGDPAWQLINWVASGMLMAAAVLAVLLARGPERLTIRFGLLAVAWFGCILPLAHGLYGVVDRALIVTGARLVESEEFVVEDHAWVLWDLLAFEPWFLIEGTLFGLAGWAALSGARARRLWVWICLAGLLAALATAVAGVRVA